MQELEVTEFCAMAKINRYIKMGEGAEGKERGGEEAPSSAGHLRRMTHCGFARPFAHALARGAAIGMFDPAPRQRFRLMMR